uniref:Na+ dependent nucleoside transporter N-terminal domain-containing protein n=1 Tax=Vibrio cholerae TaxID=666 RepID=UPI00399D7A52
MSLFMSLIGMAVLLGIAVLLSSNRKAINLRTVGGALLSNFYWVHYCLYVLGPEGNFCFSDACSRML